MKLYFNIALVLCITFFVAKNQLFNHSTNPSVYETSSIDIRIFQKLRDSFVGQQIKLSGTVKNSRFVIGVGYYELVGADGAFVSVFCDHYPPLNNDMIEVVVFVHPIIKIDNTPVTLQTEVEIPV